MTISEMVAEDVALLSGERPCAVQDCRQAASVLCVLDEGPGLLIGLCPLHADQALDGKWDCDWYLPSSAPDEGEGSSCY